MEGQVYKFEVSRRETGSLALEPIKNGQQACEFCFKHLDGLIKEWRETSAAIYLDKENRALGYEIISEGTADACLFDTKQLIRSACLVGANSVIVAHNHPSGNARPSKLDIEQAEKIRRGLHAAGLILLDFVILTESGEGYTMCDERVIKCEIAPENGQEKHKEQKPAEWSEEDENCLNYALWCVMKTRHFAAKDACDLDACRYAERWLESFPERFNLKLKQEWSEEDNNSLEYLHELIDFGITENFFDAQTAGDMKSWINIKLKSLRSSPHWKPSEEQMEALEIVCKAHPETITGERILSLLNDLKRL